MSALAALMASATPCTGREEMFFGPDEETPVEHRIRVTAAIALCAACPVRQACLKAAIEGDEVGVWGGTDEAGRGRRDLQQTPQTPEQVAEQAQHERLTAEVLDDDDAEFRTWQAARRRGEVTKLPRWWEWCSASEWSALRLLADERGTREISAALGISRSWAQTLVADLRAMAGGVTVRQLVVEARQAGVLRGGVTVLSQAC